MWLAWVARKARKLQVDCRVRRKWMVFVILEVAGGFYLFVFTFFFLLCFEGTTLFRVSFA